MGISETPNTLFDVITAVAMESGKIRVCRLELVEEKKKGQKGLQAIVRDNGQTLMAGGGIFFFFFGLMFS